MRDAWALCLHVFNVVEQDSFLEPLQETGISLDSARRINLESGDIRQPSH
jgi:hypothetical protein